MAALKFAKTHNLVAFLSKPEESDGFEQIVDFLNANPIKYALTVNPTIYTSCIKQFWATAKAKTINGEVQIQALIDGKKKLTFYKAFFAPQWKFLIHTILHCLSAKTTAWNEFSSTMASAVICLATNQKFNFSKYIFDNMVKNLEGGVKFLMYPRLVQVFLDKQVEGMSKHKDIYVTPSHIKKAFANMKRLGKDFSGKDTPLFPTMIVQAQEQVGEGSEIPTNSHHTPTITQPSTSKPQKKQSRRKQRKDTEDPQLSGPTEPITNDTKNVANVPTHSNDPVLTVLDLEKTKTSQAAEITELKERVKKLENKNSQAQKIIQDMAEKEVDMAEKDVSTVDPVTTASEVVTTANVVVSTTEVTTNSATTITVDELTLAQTLIEIKAAKPKVVTTAATITTTAVTRPKARGIVVQEPNAELEEEEKLVRQREENANIAEWDNVQAMMDADYELAARLQAEEQGELSIEEKSRLFMELMNKRKKHFARLRAEEQRRKPPTKA
ncbi:hypothetical protein Tco_1084566 [Tanacetum coccineum]